MTSGPKNWPRNAAPFPMKYSPASIHLSREFCRHCRSLRKTMIFAAEIHQRLDPCFGFERVRRKNLSEKNLMISSRVDFNGLAFQITQCIAQQWLAFRTVKINLWRTRA